MPTKAKPKPKQKPKAKPTETQNSNLGIAIGALKLNDKNPRLIKDLRFEKLKHSIKKFPKMMELRPIIVDGDNRIIGGNMRYRALQALGYDVIPERWVRKAEDLTEDERNQFIIKDNVGFGEWDFELLANEWSKDGLLDWGLNMPNFDTELDLSVLGNQSEEVDKKMQEMTGGVMRAICIEFKREDYEQAAALVKAWRDNDRYIGEAVIKALQSE